MSGAASATARAGAGIGPGEIALDFDHAEHAVLDQHVELDLAAIGAGALDVEEHHAVALLALGPGKTHARHRFERGGACALRNVGSCEFGNHRFAPIGEDRAVAARGLAGLIGRRGRTGGNTGGECQRGGSLTPKSDTHDPVPKQRPKRAMTPVYLSRGRLAIARAHAPLSYSGTAMA